MPKLADQWLRDILNAFYRQPISTRAEILLATGLNPASASHALRHLIRSRTVLKVGELQSKAGRKREVLRLNPDAGYFVAVDLEASPIRFALTDLTGEIRCRWEEDVAPHRELDVAKIVRGVKMVSRNLPAAHQSRVLAAGIARPGVIDAAGLVTAVNLGWRDFPFEKSLRAILNLPFYMENAARMFVLAERSSGVARQSENCIYVEVGKGVGAGIITDGRFLKGHSQAASHFGHITVDPQATDLCNCGKRGCLEAIASGPNIVRQYLEKLQQPAGNHFKLRVTDVFERARRGEQEAGEVLDRAAAMLGLGISYLIALLNPEIVILGGDLVHGEDVMLPRIRKELERHVRDWMGPFRVCMSALGPDIGLKGAASLAFRSLLRDSTLLHRLLRKVPAAAIPRLSARPADRVPQELFAEG
jgi:predicted NBD/HSP70 family sugar kinase